MRYPRLAGLRARALERVGILTAEERAQIVDAFDQIRAEAGTPGFYQGATDEDVHTLVIRKLKERAGNVADKIHTGRSRNEQVSLDTRMWLREECADLQALLCSVMGHLLGLAADVLRRHHPRIYPHAPRPGRALAALPALLLRDVPRDWERFEDARRRANMLPLGSGALAGSGFPFDRQAIAADLGFDGITRNSMDVSGDRDFALDFLYAATVTMIHLSRLAEDWILYSSEEFGWLELGDDVTSGSSLMPQKKNPDSLELIRGKSGRVVGCLTSLMVTMKGLPMTYNRDMQEDKIPLFDAADQVADSLLMMSQRDRFHAPQSGPARCRSAEESWVVATDLAEALARAGTPFHQAHQIVGRFVLESVQRRQEALGLDRRRDAALRSRIHRRFRGAAQSRRGNEVARNSGRHRLPGCRHRARTRQGNTRKVDRMTKSYRQGQILKLIRSKGISTQEELAQELKSQGIAATQVTLSRDIRDLRLVKTREGYKEMAPEDVGPQFSLLAAEFLRDVLRAQNHVILKTSPGHANSVAVALDNEEWPEVVGTIAGDDTILVITPDNPTAESVQENSWPFSKTASTKTARFGPNSNPLADARARIGALTVREGPC